VSVEFIGMIGTHEVSEIRARQGPFLQPDFVQRIARAHEDSNFDRVLVGYGSSSAEGTQVAAYAAACTERLGFLIAHRPGFVFPTLAARTFATLDQFTGGRVAVHIITGGSDADQRREGDYLSKDERYERTDEYLDVLKAAWTRDDPISYAGSHYRFEDFRSDIRPLQIPRIPLYFGGSSAAAYRVGGKQSDIFMLWGEPLAETAEQIAAVRAAAQRVGRTEGPRFSVSFRPILGATEDLAWERAHRILDTIRSSGGGKGAFVSSAALVGGTAAKPQSVAAQRLLAAAEKGELHDRALWTPTAAATNASGNTTALVGTPDTVAQAIVDYVHLGVTSILIRGFDPLQDAIDYGRELIPLVRSELDRCSGDGPT
jgi:alkanesulfonate monooxygenase